MTLTFHPSLVSIPSVAPATDNPGLTYWIRHRRKNQLGEHSKWSVNRQTDLPATITPEPTNNAELLEDEIIISDDGVTWRIFPRAAGTIGPVTITAFDGAWAATTDSNTQTTIENSLEFGSFDASNEPFKDVFIRNSAVALSTLTFNFSEPSTNSLALAYSGLIRVELLEVYSEIQKDANVSFNKSIIWEKPGQSFNLIDLVLGLNGFCKIRIHLVNFPTNGTASNTIALGMEVVPDQRIYQLGFGVDWRDGSLLVDGNTFVAELLSATEDNVVRVAPYKLNSAGIAYVSFSTRELGFSGVGNYSVVVLSNGELQVVDQASLPANSFELARFDGVAGSPFISNVTYQYDLNPNSWLYNDTALGVNLFVNYGAIVTLATELQDVTGIKQQANFISLLGRSWVLSGAAVAAGDTVIPDAASKAVTGASNIIALSSTTAADQQLEVLLGGGAASGINTVPAVASTAGSLAIDLEYIDSATLQRTENITSVTFSNITANKQFNLLVTGDGLGAWAIDGWTNVTWDNGSKPLFSDEPKLLRFVSFDGVNLVGYYQEVLTSDTEPLNPENGFLWKDTGLFVSEYIGVWEWIAPYWYSVKRFSVERLFTGLSTGAAFNIWYPPQEQNFVASLRDIVFPSLILESLVADVDNDPSYDSSNFWSFTITNPLAFGAKQLFPTSGTGTGYFQLNLQSNAFINWGEPLRVIFSVTGAPANLTCNITAITRYVRVFNV